MRLTNNEEVMLVFYGVSLTYFKRTKQHPEKLTPSENWNFVMPIWRKFRDLKFKDRKLMRIHTNWLIDLQWSLSNCDNPKQFSRRLVLAIKWYNRVHPIKYIQNVN